VGQFWNLQDGSKGFVKRWCRVIIDIKPEYDGYICGVWQSLSDKTNDFVVSRQELEDMYNTVSLASIRFMREMLERLEG
jgi:hypothetical protein